MESSPSFADSIAGIASALRDGPRSYFDLNRAAGHIDRLGRLLHGLGYVRHREIAGCFMAAIAELHAAMELPEDARGDRVTRAVEQLEAALVHTEQGTTA